MSLRKTIFYWLLTTVFAWVMSAPAFLLLCLDTKQLLHPWACLGVCLLVVLYISYGHLIEPSPLPYIATSAVVSSRFNILIPSIFSLFWLCVLGIAIVCWFYLVVHRTFFSAELARSGSQLEPLLKIAYLYIGILFLLGTHLPFTYAHFAFGLLTLGNIVLLCLLSHLFYHEG